MLIICKLRIFKFQILTLFNFVEWKIFLLIPIFRKNGQTIIRTYFILLVEE